MRVSLNIGQQNNFINVARVNQGIRDQNPAMRGGIHSRRRDRSDISPAGKANSLIEQLMKRKQEITDSKSKLVEDTLKKGGTMQSIQTQLETYEEQLKMIDEQIAASMAPETEKQTDKKEETDESIPKTKEEIESDKIDSLTNITSDIERTKVLSSTKDGLDRNIRILKMEMKQDTLQSPPTEARATQASKKEAKIDKLEDRSRELSENIGNQLVEINEDVAQNAKPRPADEVAAEKAMDKAEKAKSETEKTAEEKARDDREGKIDGEGNS